ncbi:hypothetical protein K0B04_01515 [Patescibacteria group bacterium]|nr:hypothetical protein [Patescibacteria group bacterium]
MSNLIGEEKKEEVLPFAYDICFFLLLVVPFIFSYPLTSFVIARIFGIEGWQRTLPLFLLCIYVIFEILLGHLFNKYEVDIMISNFLKKSFNRWR